MLHGKLSAFLVLILIFICIGTITFIDFEYGGLNLSAFDVADYFCEFAGKRGKEGGRESVCVCVFLVYL